MPDKSISIDKYVIAHLAGGPINVEWNDIMCYSGGAYVGHIRFFPKGQVPASNMDLGEYFF
ncbi:MAG: hypothetical protein LUQ38_11740 [Methanotrichaceae archaeon]|nr:hypothetical protein [Methanotrichaceae archaeon]MDD1757226.1 hypothetical protein [Methanotrichaceae archaeon]